MNVFDLFAKITLDSSEYDAGLDSAESKSEGFGSKLKSGLATATKVGAAAIGAVGAAATAAGVAITKQTGELAAYGDNIDKMSQKMGMSATAYQEWDAILQHSGASIETMKTGMKTLATAAETGNDAFKQLGMSQEEIANMSQEELFGATITALQNVESETERTYLASKLLGKGGTELGALLNTSAEDTEKMRQRVHELGGVMSDEAVKAAAAYQDSLQDMTTSMDGLKRGLISGFMPALTTVMDGLTEIFSGNSDKGLGLLKTGISDTIQHLQEVVPKMMEIGRSIFSALYQAVLENLPQIVSGGTELIVNLVSGIVEALPSLVDAAFVILTTLTETLLEQAPVLAEAGLNALTSLTEGMDPIVMIEKVGEILGSLVDYIIEWIPALLDQGIAMVDEMSAGLSENGPAAIEAIGAILGDLITKIIDNLPEFLAKGIELIASLAEGLIRNLPAIIGAIAQIIGQLIAYILRSMPQFLSSGLQMIASIASGLLNAQSRLWSAIAGIIRQAINKFKSTDWGSVGRNIIEGIANGVKNAAGKIADAARSAAKKALDAAKSFLGIHSPSRVFREQIGKNISLGLAGGISGYAAEVEDAAEDLAELATDPFAELDSVTRTISADGAVRAAQTPGRGSDRDVLNRILEILEGLDLSNVGVYMDGKALVGELVPAMDLAMGREASYKGRGVI